MNKAVLVILLFLAIGCTSNTVSIGTQDVFITEDANSDRVISEGNSVSFVVGKEKRNIALFQISSKAMTPDTLIMPFSVDGVEQLQNMLDKAATEEGLTIPLDIIKNNRGDYLACVLLRSNNTADEYMMCEMNGTGSKNSKQRRSIFFTIDLPKFYGIVDSTFYYMTSEL